MAVLEEGKEYLFDVVGEISIENEAVFYILADIFSQKHLLSKKTYRNYSIIVGKAITCKVDKINCQGRIYLEPKHPLYKIGQVCEFTFKQKEVIVNKKGVKKNVLHFSDKHGNKAMAIIKQLDKFNNFDLPACHCRIIDIKKAILIVEIQMDMFNCK
ncbi:MAG TPA: hypothetical protein DDX39_01335 [Bacteroidales bacterium]|nr:MAG: hypothetical protein A2W98_07545 [Bacteroidetes bacterium GWF2_33_38]OFY92289.1 MAG: hypothetical protein A2236_06770 [Bacteroidetes bacterium RIFOXYA2_FULL_33_7]HBF87255.1 hypothetical protein [Bacteroidales bacterium]